MNYIRETVDAVVRFSCGYIFSTNKCIAAVYSEKHSCLFQIVKRDVVPWILCL